MPSGLRSLRCSGHWTSSRGQDWQTRWAGAAADRISDVPPRRQDRCASWAALSGAPVLPVQQGEPREGDSFREANDTMESSDLPRRAWEARRAHAPSQ
ncbi:hypothetical protein ACCO45_006049 [Purpureocillium lilacinum]|uniref:Uncharacterized protein n=1 Tax=Purpureocillium lilacinum TaxID=33203 RepID=A0ACC4DYD4_PURLI